MWLYVPSECCPCSPASEDSTSPSDSHFQSLASSAWWRGKQRQPQSWRRAWKTARWMRRLSGLTSEPSTLERGVAAWISSWAGSPARTSPSPGSGPGSEASDPACSLTSVASWRSAERQWCSLRTSGALFPTSEPSSENLPISGSIRSGTCYLRPRWAPPIAESGGSAWPTAKARDAKNPNRPGSGAWKRKYEEDGYAVELNDMAAAWPTPTSRDHKDGADPSGEVETNALLGRAAPRWSCPSSPPAPPTQTPGSGSSQGGRRLNPLFVEHLMGWPIGWTDFAPVEMASWLSKARSHFESFFSERE